MINVWGKISFYFPTYKRLRQGALVSSFEKKHVTNGKISSRHCVRQHIFKKRPLYFKTADNFDEILFIRVKMARERENSGQNMVWVAWKAFREFLRLSHPPRSVVASPHQVSGDCNTVSSQDKLSRRLRRRSLLIPDVTFPSRLKSSTLRCAAMMVECIQIGWYPSSSNHNRVFRRIERSRSRRQLLTEDVVMSL